MEVKKKRRKQYLLHDDSNIPRSTTYQNSRRSKPNTGSTIVTNMANYALDNDDEQQLIAESVATEIEDDSGRFECRNVRPNVEKLTDTMYKGPIIEGNLNWEKLPAGEKYINFFQKCKFEEYAFLDPIFVPRARAINMNDKFMNFETTLEEARLPKQHKDSLLNLFQNITKSNMPWTDWDDMRKTEVFRIRYWNAN